MGDDGPKHEMNFCRIHSWPSECGAETARYCPWEGGGTPLLTPIPPDVPVLASLPTREWVPQRDTKHAASSVSEGADLDI